MARADLVVNLVETGIKGDLPRFKKTAEAIAAEATARHQYHLADKLHTILTSTSNEAGRQFTHAPELQNSFYEIHTQKTLDDLTLDDEVRASFNELIEEHFRKDILRAYNLEPRHRLLLAGPPGNGKTTLAEALANQLCVPLFIVKYEGIFSRYLGETAQHVDMLFEHIKTQRCVLFFDEFDAIGKERDDLQDNGEIKRVVNSLLKQIDLLPSHVIVIAATNHASMLDRALWRRFQMQVQIPGPTQKTAVRWLGSFEERIGHSFGVALSTIARRLSGLSFAELEEFALDVQRKYVLGLPESERRIKDITTNCLKIWENRYKVEE
jgi:SpoVK/Ycf46/Vps4 family AAA+-type ATPase